MKFFNVICIYMIIYKYNLQKKTCFEQFQTNIINIFVDIAVKYGMR